MTKKHKQDGDTCPRCARLEIALNHEFDLTERILAMFKDTAFPDVAAVHEKAGEILKQVQEYRTVVAPKHPGRRLLDPLLISVEIDRAVRGKALTKLTQQDLADLLHCDLRDLLRKLDKYYELSGLTWEVYKRLIIAASQPDSWELRHVLS